MGKTGELAHSEDGVCHDGKALFRMPPDLQGKIEGGGGIVQDDGLPVIDHAVSCRCDLLLGCSVPVQIFRTIGGKGFPDRDGSSVCAFQPAFRLQFPEVCADGHLGAVKMLREFMNRDFFLRSEEREDLFASF